MGSVGHRHDAAGLGHSSQVRVDAGVQLRRIAAQQLVLSRKPRESRLTCPASVAEHSRMPMTPNPLLTSTNTWKTVLQHMRTPWSLAATSGSDPPRILQIMLTPPDCSDRHHLRGPRHPAHFWRWHSSRRQPLSARPFQPPHLHGAQHLRVGGRRLVRIQPRLSSAERDG